MVSPLSDRVRLRPWQHAAIAAFSRRSGQDFLAVATPGAGKTTFGLVAARLALAEHPRRLLIVTPTAHLKSQWATAAARLQLHLDPRWSPAEAVIAPDVHGIVTTYQQMAMNPDVLGRLAHGAFVILDEIHHGGEERAWGAALQQAFGGAGVRLTLSGTPFRSDTRAIPFVRYQNDAAVPDFEYGYNDALRDGGVVRPVYFPAVGGVMEWSAPDGSLHSASFDDPLTSELANQRLRTALSLEGEWLGRVIDDAQRRLQEVRRTQPDAGGLVIATDQAHAHGIAELLRWRCHVRASVVTSDDPTASKRIAAFAADSSEWLVAVRMVSEGVDIPRLRVGVYATATTTELFFRQAVGRFVRWQSGIRNQRAWLYVPDDPRLRTWASQIAVQRRHSLARAESCRDPLQIVVDDAELEQISLFAPLSAVATSTTSVSPWQEQLPWEWSETPASVELTLAPPPAVVGPTDIASGSTVRQTKDALRVANADAARELVRRTRMTHAQVNVELNRRAGIRRIAEATMPQLEARLDQATRWLLRL